MSDKDRHSDESRRDFLKKSLVAGAVVWSAPAVTTLPGGRAWAQTYTSCACNGEAYGLSVSLLGGAPSFFGVDSTFVDTGILGTPGVVTVRATAISGADSSTVNGICSADASIATLDVIVGPTATPTLRVTTGLIESVATAACGVCATTGSSSIVRLKVNKVNVNVTGACNVNVLNLNTVFINEHSCAGDTLSVNALHIVIPGIIDLIAAHASAGATGCPCPTC